jgi:hypothetical protein
VFCLGCQNDTSHHKSSTLLPSPCVSDNIPSNPTIPSRSITRPVSRNFPDTNRGRSQKKQARRKKRSKEKKKLRMMMEEVDGLDDDAEIKLADLFTPYLIVRASGKIRSFEFGADDVGHKGGTQVIDLTLFSSPFLIFLNYDSSSPLWRRTPSKSTTYPNPPN